MSGIVVIEPPFVLREHEDPSLANKDAGEIHRPLAMYSFAFGIDTRGSSSCLEAIDLHPSIRKKISSRWSNITLFSLSFRTTFR